MKEGNPINVTDTGTELTIDCTGYEQCIGQYFDCNTMATSPNTLQTCTILCFGKFKINVLLFLCFFLFFWFFLLNFVVLFVFFLSVGSGRVCVCGFKKKVTNIKIKLGTRACGYANVVGPTGKTLNIYANSYGFYQSYLISNNSIINIESLGDYAFYYSGLYIHIYFLLCNTN